MKAVLYLIILAGIAYGGMYVYENYMSGSVGRAIDNTSNFATDSNVKNFDANAAK